MSVGDFVFYKGVGYIIVYQSNDYNVIKNEGRVIHGVYTSELSKFKVENCVNGRAVQIPFDKPKCTCGSTVAKAIGHYDWCDIKE